ncbi:MAG: DUF3572 family protein [Gemmobacter sp.]
MSGNPRADEIAVVALAWLAADVDLMGRFMVQSGLSPGDLRNLADAPETLAAVLDFVLEDEATARRFCMENRLGAEQLMRARAALPGGADPHWT